MMGGDCNVIMTDRGAFMQQAYNALFGGGIHEMPDNLQLRIVEEVARDLCTVIRNAAPDPIDGRRQLDEFRERLLQATRPN